MCGDITVTRELMRSYIDLLNESKDTTDQTYFVENSSYRLTHEETDLFQDIIKITNFPWRKALELLKDSVRYLGPYNVKFPDRELFPHEYLRYGRDSLINYTNILVRLKKASLEIVKTAILDGERTATGGHENFFLKDEEIIFMTIVLCREIKTLLEDPRVASIDNETFTPTFNVKEFADDSEERLEAIYDLAQQVYKAMQRRLQRETEVISERRKKVDEMFGFGSKKSKRIPINIQLINRIEKEQAEDYTKLLTEELYGKFNTFAKELDTIMGDPENENPQSIQLEQFGRFNKCLWRHALKAVNAKKHYEEEKIIDIKESFCKTLLEILMPTER
jgi:hypothetical protein